MKTTTVTEFKAKALRMMEEIARSGESLLVTKHGNPLVEVRPAASSTSVATPGRLAHTLVHEGDIVSPLGPDAWESAR
jgi:antitoxin (DNA-binding transcriptional repressor) of toxin-antitoxin stability system